MAFTTEQKDTIRKRAEELVASEGISTGTAAQRAIKELFTPEQISDAFTVKPPMRFTSLPPAPLPSLMDKLEVPAPPKPQTVSPVQETRPPEIIKVDTELEEAETKYRLNRISQLKEQGLSAEAADEQIKKELLSFREPVPLGFGDIAERREGGGASALRASLEGLGIPGPRETETVPSAPVGINYKELTNQWSEGQKITRDQAEKQVDIFRIQLVEPRIEKYKQSGLSSVEAERKALEEAFEVLGNISNKVEDKSTYLTAPEQLSSGDPWIRAFEKQVTPGEGVPNLSDEEKAYLNAVEESKIETKVAELKRSPSGSKKNVYILSDGTRLSEDDYEPRLHGRRLKQTVQEDRTDEELRSKALAESPKPWWIDPELSKKVIAEPEKYEQRGIFSTTTPYGTSKETTANWLLRGALLPFNAAAGFLSQFGYDFGPLEEAREEERKKKGFEDSPVLLNIAENRGFMGEAKEAAELAGVKTVDTFGPALYYTTLAGGFAADILDPSLDIARAAGITGRSAVRSFRGLGKVYKDITFAQKASPSLKEAAKLGVNDFLDNALGADVFARNKRFEAGDVRGLIAKNLTEDFKAADAVTARGADDARAVDAALSPSQKSSVWGRKYSETVAKSAEGATAADVLASMDKIYKEDKLAKSAAAIGADLDNFAGAAPSLARIRRKDLARSLGALVSVDEAAKSAMSGSRGIKSMVKTLKDTAPDSYNRLKTILFYDEAAKEAAKVPISDLGLGGGGPPIENIVAITRNTWTTKAKAKDILARVKASPVGKIAEGLKDVELVIASRGGVKDTAASRGTKAKATEARVLPAYKLTAEQAAEVKKVAQQLQTYNKLDKQTAKLIDELLKKNQITTENFRTLLDGNIDLIAEGLAGTGKSGVTRARDLSNTSVQEQMQYLVPLERRTFGREAYKKIRESLTGEVAITGNLSVGQKQLLNRATQDISGLDTKLRKELEEIMKDPRVQEIYGVKGGLPSYEMGLGRLIVGPKPKAIPPKKGQKTRYPSIEETMEGILNNMFYAKQTRENAFDLLTGTSVTTNTGVFTDAAMEILRPLIENAARATAKNPDLFWNNVRSVIEEGGRIVSGAVEVPGKDLLRYSKDEITKVLDETAGKIPAEVQAAAYYRKEADRVAREAISDLINTEIGKGRIDFREQLDPDVVKAIEVKLGTRPLGLETQIKTVANRARRQLQGKERFQITAEDVAEIFFEDGAIVQFAKEKADKIKKLSQDLNIVKVTKANLDRTGQAYPPSLTAEINRLSGEIANVQGTKIPNKGTREYERLSAEGSQAIMNKSSALVSDPDFMEAIAPYFEIGEDVAAGIIRRNKLNKTDVDVQEVERLFRQLTNKGGKEYKQLEILLGEDLAKQLREDLLTASKDIKKDLIDLLEKRYSKGVTKATIDTLSSFKDTVEELRYLAILNSRPRFHGPNLITGAEIVYSTTGRIVNPLDLFEGAKILRNTNPTEIIFRDASGRGYTSGELNNMLGTTGRSVYSATVPQAQQKAVAALLESRPDSFSDQIRGAKELFKVLPLSEDLLYRYSMLKAALKEGRSVDDALTLARASMFDLSDITKAEENLRRLALFYAFQRNSLVNTLNNLTSLKGLKRLTGIKRTRDNLSRFFTSDEDREYAPSYARSRVLLGKVGFDFEKGKDLLIASPPLQQLDSFYSLMDFMQGDIQGLFGSALRPEYKAAFGVDDKFSRELTEVPIEHINILKLTTDHPEEVINYMLAGFGAEPTFSFADKNGNIVIPLDTAKQRAAYKKFMDITSMLGITTPATDYSRFISPEGTKVGAMGPGGRTAFMTGAATPLATFTPEKQAYYDRISRLAELNRTTGAMRQTEVEQAQAVETPAETEQREEQKDAVTERGLVKPLAISELPKQVRTKYQIGLEILAVQKQILKGDISYEKGVDKIDKLTIEFDAAPE
jgi:hypothetical protein